MCRIRTCYRLCSIQLLYQWANSAKPTKMCCSSCFIPFWDTKYNTPHIFLLAGYSIMLHESGHPFLVCIAALPFRANDQTRQLPISLQHSSAWCVTARPPQSLGTHRLALFPSFRTVTLTYCLAPFYWRRVAFGLLRVNSDLGLYRWTISGASA